MNLIKTNILINQNKNFVPNKDWIWYGAWEDLYRLEREREEIHERLNTERSNMSSRFPISATEREAFATFQKQLEQGDCLFFDFGDYFDRQTLTEILCLRTKYPETRVSKKPAVGTRDWEFARDLAKFLLRTQDWDDIQQATEFPQKTNLRNFANGTGSQEDYGRIWKLIDRLEREWEDIPEQENNESEETLQQDDESEEDWKMSEEWEELYEQERKMRKNYRLVF